MIINTTIEQPDGSLQFTGELTGAELTTVVSYGLNTLFLLGHIPAQNITSSDEESEETLQ